MRRALLGLAVGSALAGCGGASTGSPAGGGAAAADYPVEVDVSMTRVGSALRLDVEALGRGAPANAPFEDPARWTITVRQAEVELSRMVNGSVQRERESAGERWDTTVRFNLAYGLRGGRDVEVRLVPPGGRPTVRRVALDEIPEGVPEPGSGVEAADAADAAIAAEREAQAQAEAEAAAEAAKAEAARKAAERKKRKKKARRRRR